MNRETIMIRTISLVSAAALLVSAAANAQTVRVGLFAEPSSIDPH